MFASRLLVAGALIGATLGVSGCSEETVEDAPTVALSGDALVEQGRYLVSIMACTDCHTPGHFMGKPNETRFLGGSDVGFEIPGLGVFYGANLTPDKETGIGSWSEAEIVTALTTGERPDGRILAPAMPWHAYAGLKPDDARAVAAYLKTLPPIHNKAPGPYGPSETPASAFHRIMAPTAKP